MPLPPTRTKNYKVHGEGLPKGAARFMTFLASVAVVSFEATAEYMNDANSLTRAAGAIGAIGILGYFGKDNSQTVAVPQHNQAASADRHNPYAEDATLYRQQASPEYQLAMAEMDAIEERRRLEVIANATAPRSTY